MDNKDSAFVFPISGKIQSCEHYSADGENFKIPNHINTISYQGLILIKVRKSLTICPLTKWVNSTGLKINNIKIKLIIHSKEY